MSVPPMTPGTSLDGLRQEGVRLLQAGNTDAALQVLSQATEANPSDGVAFQYLGIARTKTGAVEGGIAALQEAARLLPMNAGIQLNLGVAQAQANRVDDARQTLLRAQEIDPSNGRITQMLASLPKPAALTPAPAGLSGVGGYDIFVDGSQSAAPAPLHVPSVLGLNPPTLSPPTLSPAQNTWDTSGQSFGGDTTGGLSSLPPSAISARMLVREPTTSERVLRGMGWGAICAQWWTLLTFFWEVVVGGLLNSKPGEQMTAPVAIIATIIFAIFFGFVGAIMGVVMAFMRAEVSTGAVIGVIVGLVFLGLEMLINGFGGAVNIFFWFFTGRFVGSNIAARVNATVDA